MSDVWNGVKGAWNDVTNLGHANQVPGNAGPAGTLWGGDKDAANKAMQREQGLGQQAGQLGSQYGQQFGDLSNQAGQMAGQQYGQLTADQSDQRSALGNLANAAAGKGPSAAQAQLQSGVDQGIAAQMAMANSTRGSAGLANAQRNAIQTGAGMSQSAANQAAQLRAQEMQAAQNAYMQGSLGMGAQAGQLSQGFQNQQLGALQAGAGAQQGFGQLQQGYENQGLGVQTSAANASLGNQGIQQGVVNQNASVAPGLIGSGMSAGGGALMALASDERLKRGTADAGNIDYDQGAWPLTPTLTSDEDRKHESPGHDAPADRFLESLKPKTFSYKGAQYEPNPDGVGDRYLGVMAQDVERTPEGQKIVEHDQQGVKQLNLAALSGANSAGLGRLHERLKSVELQLARKRMGLR